MTCRDREQLKQRIHRAPYDACWNTLRNRTSSTIDAVRETTFGIDIGGIGWYSKTPMLPEATLMALLEDNANALKYVEDAIDFVVDYSDTITQEGSERFLLHSHTEIAFCVDMLRNRLHASYIEKVKSFMKNTAIPFTCYDSYTSYSGGNNIAWCKNVTAAICALLWGEDCGFEDWQSVVDHGITHSRCYLKYGCDPSGFSYEGTGYGHGVFQVMFCFAQLLKENGYADLFQSEPEIRQVFEGIIRVILPDQSFLINDNDVGLSGAEGMPYLLFAYHAYKDPLYLSLWNAYQGPDHRIRPYGDLRPYMNRVKGDDSPVPEQRYSFFFTILYWDADGEYPDFQSCNRPTSHYAKGTEIVNARTSWSKDAVYVNIQGAGRSRCSLTHRHADAGHFSLFAHGDYLAVDTGRYNTDEDQHNVMLVDNTCHAGIDPGWGMDFWEGKLENYQHDQILTHVCADMALEKYCFWARRHFLFVNYGLDDAYLITIDNFNKDNQRHTYQWQLQGNPDYNFTIENSNSATLNGNNARLDMTFIAPSKLDFPDTPHTLSLRQDVKEWSWPYGRDQDPDEVRSIDRQGLLVSSVRRPRLIAEVDGLNGHLMSVVSPRRSKTPPLSINTVTQRRLMHIEIDCHDFTDTIITALDHRYIRTDSFESFSEILFTRRLKDGTLIHTWTDNGESIREKVS